MTESSRNQGRPLSPLPYLRADVMSERAATIRKYASHAVHPTERLDVLGNPDVVPCAWVAGGAFTPVVTRILGARAQGEHTR